VQRPKDTISFTLTDGRFQIDPYSVPHDRHDDPTFEPTMLAWAEALRRAVAIEGLAKIKLELSLMRRVARIADDAGAEQRFAPVFRHIAAFVEDKTAQVLDEFGEGAGISIDYTPGFLGGRVACIGHHWTNPPGWTRIVAEDLDRPFRAAYRANRAWWDNVETFAITVRLAQLTAHRRLALLASQPAPARHC
jgi:hypothetical protein